MARCYANETFPLPTVEILRHLGHDVLTTTESGRAGQAMPDADVLAFAMAEPNNGLQPTAYSVRCAPASSGG